MQVCSSQTKNETQLLSVSSSPPSTIASQPSSPQHRLIILPPRGRISPIKVRTSPKRLLLPHIVSPGSSVPVCGTGTCTNCVVVDKKCVSGVKIASVPDSSCAAQSISSTVISDSKSSDSVRNLSSSLQVDGILTVGADSASKCGIISVACGESCMQETMVITPVTSISGLQLPVSICDNVSSSRTVTSWSSDSMYQSTMPTGQVSSDKGSGMMVTLANCLASVCHTVAVPHPAVCGPRAANGTRTVSVTSVRKMCPPSDAQKRSVVVRLFPEPSSSDVQPFEKCQPVAIVSASSAKSPDCVLLVSAATGTAENESKIISSSELQQSSVNMPSVNTTAVHQQCPFSQADNVVAVEAVSAASSSICHTTVARPTQKVTESVVLSLNGSINSSVLVDSGVLNTSVLQMPTVNSPSGGAKLDSDSDSDSVVIIDADIVPSLSPSRNDAKRSSAAQNVILLNHHKSLSPHDIDLKQSSPKMAAAEMVEKSRTKRKSVLGTRSLESTSDEGIILSASSGFDNGKRRSHPNRRKSLPQRRTDISVPQLQFCTKQWKRDINLSFTANASPAFKQPESKLAKTNTGTDSSEKPDGNAGPELSGSRSSLQCSQNSSNRRKRKNLNHCESPVVKEAKRSKRTSPIKSGDSSCNSTLETAANRVCSDATIDLGKIRTSSSSDVPKTEDSMPINAISSRSAASAANKANRCDKVKSAEPSVNSSLELQLLGKDKRSMEMSVTNEDGVVENLVVTIIDISSSEEDEDDVEIRSVASAKLDVSTHTVTEAETSQPAVSRSLSSGDASTVKTVQDESCTVSTDAQPMSESSCKTKPVHRKCRKTVQYNLMGRKVLLAQRKTTQSDDKAHVAKVKQVTQLCKKSVGQRNAKADAGGTIKQSRVDSDAISVGYLGPIVRVRGSKTCPLSCSVVSGSRDVDEGGTGRLKQKSVVLNSSCFPTSFQLRDSVPWKCVFCHQSSSYRTLGDLFGPYYAKADGCKKSDGVKCQGSPSKDRNHSAKKSPKSGYTLVSQRRRQQLQKYAPQAVEKSPKKSPKSPDTGIPPEIWLHEDCAIWTNGICLSPVGQLCGLEAAVTLSLQTVYSLFYIFVTVDELS